ncbi:hypothetical protein [Microvirga calopogonii]|uniref:hypothetical protein n=1 Tax=Microvirga calopogonii TaxID=2078013 RepID=UPI000E0D9769|nr:hypothetical protein [Microvirga calopogonii]
MTVISTTTVYSAERALVALETAYFDIEAERSVRLLRSISSPGDDTLSDLSHSLQARLVEGFAALASQPTDPWTRFQQLMRAADLFGHDAPIVGLIAGALSGDQARLASAEAA